MGVCACVACAPEAEDRASEAASVVVVGAAREVGGMLCIACLERVQGVRLSKAQGVGRTITSASRKLGFSDLVVLDKHNNAR